MVAALYVFLGAFTYGVVYTVWLKRRTWWNIVVGGLAGSFAVLAGAAAVAPTPGPEALALAVVLFLWTPPHFWSLAIVCREDYAAAGVPMLPVVVGDARAAQTIFASAVVLVLASLIPVAFSLGWIYAAAASGGGIFFLLKCRALVERPGRKTARAAFLASLVQLSAVLLGAMADVALFLPFCYWHCSLNVEAFDEKLALKDSQAAIGRQVGDYRFPTATASRSASPSFAASRWWSISSTPAAHRCARRRRNSSPRR